MKIFQKTLLIIPCYMIEYDKNLKGDFFMKTAYKRILLKLSGEALAGERKNGLDVDMLGEICDQIKEIIDMGVQVSIVVGGR